MKKNIINKDILVIPFLLAFGILINQYYGNQGAFPHDSFAHFETGYRIINGEHPFKDYWIISGPLVDYLQSLFFLLLGVNFQIYVLHASIFNGILTVLVFLFLRQFEMDKIYCIIYAIFFSILAYPSSGTPFVDHHSAFFSLIAVLFVILAINKGNKFFWILSPVFLICAFFSKQVPAFYVTIPLVLILIFYFYKEKEVKPFILSSASFIIFTLFVLFFGFINGITFTSFFDQYISYPQTIGQSRFQNLKNISIFGVIGNFKFILILKVLLILIFFKKKLFNKKNLYYFLIIFSFTLALIFHQILTRNQIFIFFLIPLLGGFIHIYYLKEKKLYQYLMILFCLFVTIKYHYRFNEGRKFHELINANFKLSINAEVISKSLSGLRWITPQHLNDPEAEIKVILENKEILLNDERKKMVLSNYPFLSVILEEDFFSPTRWHVFDGTDYPQIGNKFYLRYQEMFLNLLKINKIEVIYTIEPINADIIYNYIDKNCFEEKKITNNLKRFLIKKCKLLDYN